MWRRTKITWSLSDDGASIGFERTKSSGEVVASSEWFIDSGMKSSEQKRGVLTGWDPDGRVILQYDFNNGAREQSSEPWLGRVADQTKPTAPWLARRLSAAEWWEKVAPPIHEPLDALRARTLTEEQARRDAIDPVVARLEKFDRARGFSEAMRRGDRRGAEQILEEVGVTREQARAFFRQSSLRMLDP